MGPSASHCLFASKASRKSWSSWTRSSHRSTRSLTPKRWCSPMNLSGPLVRVRLPHLKMHRQHMQASASSSLRRHLQRLRQVFAFSMVALPMQVHKCHHGYPQNCNFKGCGAFTGEMSVEQMKDMGITNVMIGHSERRGEFGIFKMDDDSTLATKLTYILAAGMTCCFALGEPLPVREQGLEKVLELMDTQLSQIYSLLDPKKVVLAYEPVWAIGTGKTATEDAQATHAGIRKLIAEKASPEVAAGIRIQYGGSANAGNAAALSAMEDIDGFP